MNPDPPTTAPPDAVTRTSSASASDLLASEVARRVSSLQRRLLNGTNAEQADARGILAALRRAHPDNPLGSSAVLEHTIADFPAALSASGATISVAERAGHAAVVLFAIHQQSQRSPMHVSGVRLGQAAARLARHRDPAALDQATVRRFKAIGRASSFGESIYHLRSFVSLLRSCDPAIPLDYAALAKDLYFLQISATADNVRFQWVRQLHSPPPQKSTDDAQPAIEKTHA